MAGGSGIFVVRGAMSHSTGQQKGSGNLCPTRADRPYPVAADGLCRGSQVDPMPTFHPNLCWPSIHQIHFAQERNLYQH